MLPPGASAIDSPRPCIERTSRQSLPSECVSIVHMPPIRVPRFCRFAPCLVQTLQSGLRQRHRSTYCVEVHNAADYWPPLAASPNGPTSRQSTTANEFEDVKGNAKRCKYSVVLGFSAAALMLPEPVTTTFHSHRVHLRLGHLNWISITSCRSDCPTPADYPWSHGTLLLQAKVLSILYFV